MFGGVEVDIESLGDLVGEAAAADTEHFGTLDATIVNYSDIGGAAANIHNHGGEIVVEIITKTGATNREGLHRDR